MKLQTRLLDLEIRDCGPRDGPVLLMVPGLGRQLICWPVALIEALTAAGYRVLCFDNRDSGLSQRFPELGLPNLPWTWWRQAIGLPLRAPYSVQNLAEDALSLLDALGIGQAHVLGQDLGGMVAQRMALSAPHRVRSLCSLMSCSGARPWAGPRGAVRAALLRQAPGPRDTAGLLARQWAWCELLRSPGFEQDRELLRRQLLAAIHRAHYPEGTARQLAAMWSDPERAQALRQLSVPTLVVHGRQDPWLPFAAAEDCARRIPGARLLGIEGMGHDLPPAVVQQLLAALLPHLRSH